MLEILVLALVLNAGRFFVSNKRNRLLIFFFFNYLFICIISFYPEQWLFLAPLYLITGAYTFQLHGISVTLVLTIVYAAISQSLNPMSLVYIVINAVIIYTLHRKLTSLFINQSEWKKKLYQNAKQLNILREISMAIQQTRDLDKLLHIIVTSITAGHGLGFNRAMVFLYQENDQQLKGMIGIGPIRPEDGFSKWTEIAEMKYRLVDLLDRKDNADIDPELNAIIKHLSFKIEAGSTFEEVLQNETHALISTKDTHDPILRQLQQLFDIEDCLIVPMIYQAERIGVIVIDNPVTRKMITAEDIDNVMPLSLQAAISIHQLNLYQNIKELSYTDGLTGLKNQRTLQNDLDHLMQEPHPNFAVMMIDIDYFKLFNDTHGHLLGNKVLQTLADTLQALMTNKDQSYRFGGEEFSVILTDITVEKAYERAERIRRTIEQTVFPKEASQPSGSLTVTIGVCHYHQINGLTTDNLLSAADDALYHGKENGKNKVVCFREGL